MAKRTGKGKFILLIAVVAAVALYFYAAGDQVKENENRGKLYKIQKTGAGAVADYTDTARRIHSAVDRGLAAGKLTVQNVQEVSKDAPCQAVEGTVRWHARQVLLAAAADAGPDAVRQAIGGTVREAGGEVLGAEPDTYNGAAVTRIDVGIRDSLAGAPVTLITDRLYVAGAKKTVPAKPEVTGKGQLALIIDDFGYSADAIGAFAAISRPITWSVLPHRPHSNEAASRALSVGHQVMLHLPMEPLAGSEQSEATTITVAMSDQEIQQTVVRAIASVPGITGVNNHQGSRATADKRVMRSVLTVLKNNSLFFVDSRTSGQSVAYATSRQMGLRTGENEIFLDNQNNVEYVKGRLRTAMRMALQQGSVTAIGHARVNTATAIREMIPELEAAGVRLVFASQLVR